MDSAGSPCVSCCIVCQNLAALGSVTVQLNVQMTQVTLKESFVCCHLLGKDGLHYLVQVLGRETLPSSSLCTFNLFIIGYKM